MHPRVLCGLGCLYLAQGVPLGIAAEYLPVVMREHRASYTAIAALSALQLPWALKPLWARVGDDPRLRLRSRALIILLQCALAACLAAYTLRGIDEALWLWLALTLFAALLAATQDIFVDGLAVRTLSAGERGLGNIAQVGAYRLGIVAGGAGLLSLSGWFGEKSALLALAVGVAALAFGALLVPLPAATTYAPGRAPNLTALTALWRRPNRAVLWIACAFKFGLHMAAAVLKPSLVDAGWSKERIGALAVSVGTLAAVAGAFAGGVTQRRLGDGRSLRIACVLQSLVCLPLLVLVTHAPRVGWVSVALALEHAASGFGTTVLFAALMGAVRREDGALQFTALSTANALSLFAAGSLAGLLADRWGVGVVFLLAAVVSVVVLPLLGRFAGAAGSLRGTEQVHS